MSHRVVLDASAALEAVLSRTHAEHVLALLEAATWVAAPDLYCAEVANALWKHVRVGDLSLDDAIDALARALDLVDQLPPATELVAEALSTAAGHGHPVYDALYGVLARRNGATVCTLDKRLALLLTAMGVPVSAPGRAVGGTEETL